MQNNPRNWKGGGGGGGGCRSKLIRHHFSTNQIDVLTYTLSTALTPIRHPGHLNSTPRLSTSLSLPKTDFLTHIDHLVLCTMFSMLALVLPCALASRAAANDQIEEAEQIDQAAFVTYLGLYSLFN